MVQKKQAGSPNSQIRVAKCGDLQGSNGYLSPATRSPLLRKRVPSTDEIVRDFKVRPCHGGGIAPIDLRVNVRQLWHKGEVFGVAAILSGM